MDEGTRDSSLRGRTSSVGCNAAVRCEYQGRDTLAGHWRDPYSALGDYEAGNSASNCLVFQIRYTAQEGVLRWWDYAVAFVLLALPVALILKQPDLGTSLLSVPPALP